MINKHNFLNLKNFKPNEQKSRLRQIHIWFDKNTQSSDSSSNWLLKVHFFTEDTYHTGSLWRMVMPLFNQFHEVETVGFGFVILFITCLGRQALLGRQK